MRYQGLGALAIGLLVTSGTYGQYSIAAPDMGAGVQLWAQRFSGSLGGTDAGFSGQATLEADTSSGVGAVGNWGKWEAGYLRFSNDTRGRVEANFRFDGQVYAVGDTLQVSQDVSMFDLFRRHTFVSSPTSSVHGLFGFKVLDLRTQVTGSTNASEAAIDELIPLPMIGVAGRIGDKAGVHGFGGVRGIHLNISGVAATVLDWSVGVAYRPTDKLRVALGYRSFSTDVEVRRGSETGFVDVGNRGAFLEAGLRF